MVNKSWINDDINLVVTSRYISLVYIHTIQIWIVAVKYTNKNT